MTAKNAIVRARTTHEMKERVEAILEGLGMNMAEAINLYLHQIAKHEGIPFPVKTPSKRTRLAMQEIEEAGDQLTGFGSVSELLQSGQR